MRSTALFLLPALLSVILLPPAIAAAEDRATTKDAEMLVHKAVAFVKKEGKEKAFPVFSNPSGPFTYRDLYVFVIDFKGVVLAHGTKKELVGKNDWNRKDKNGKLFTQAMVKLAQEKGSGWEEYLFENPVTGKLETKVAYVERVDDYFVGCGAFKP
jgi:cytochrome c